MTDSFVATREASMGRVSGILFMTLFAFGWISWSGLWSGGATATNTLLFGSGISLTLLLGTIVLFVLGRRIPPAQRSPAENHAIARQLGRGFSLTFSIEVTLILVAAGVCSELSHPEWLPAVVCIIAGVHFLPLAVLFEMPGYVITGVALCTIGVVALLAIPSLPIAFDNWYIVPSAGAAAVLWLTSGAVLLQSLRRLGRSLSQRSES